MLKSDGKVEKLILDPDTDPDQSQNRIKCSLSEGLSLPEISRTFPHNFLSNPKCMKMSHLAVLEKQGWKRWFFKVWFLWFFKKLKNLEKSDFFGF